MGVHDGAKASPVELDGSQVLLLPTGGLRWQGGKQAPQALEAAFKRGSGAGLLQLAAAFPTALLPAPVAYWRDFAKLQLTRWIALGSAVLALAEAERWHEIAPAMTGGEYLNPDVLVMHWEDLRRVLLHEQELTGKQLQDLLLDRHPAWQGLGRICFNLAEHAGDPDQPFAFMATYTTRLALGDRPQHAPLGRAIKDLHESGQSRGVARLGAALEAAAAVSPFVRTRLADQRLFTAQRLSSSEAYQLLQDSASLEDAGVVMRVPAWWNRSHPPRLRVEATIGEQQPAGVGIRALLDVRLRWSLNGQAFSDEEWAALRQQADGLLLIRGQWVEVDQQRLSRVLHSWQRVEAMVEHGGLSFAQAMRLVQRVGQPEAVVAGDSREPREDQEQDGDWAEVRTGAWLSEMLSQLRHPAADSALELGPAELRATLRPYQRSGLQWLWTLHRLGLGGCLADDMGLGKTLQVLALLAVVHKDRQSSVPDAARAKPHLIIAPASVLSNWAAEAAKFTPQLRVFVAHPAFSPRSAFQSPGAKLAASDVVMTTYGALLRYPWLYQVNWSIVVFDEAQQLKNPEAQQTQAAKKLRSSQCLALTGTPIENKPLDLWSLFDLISPGLLGTAASFQAHLSSRAESAEPYAKIRALIRPYLLRRLKSDKTIISDLPEKTELVARCSLMPQQAALYQRLIDELKTALTDAQEAGKQGGNKDMAGEAAAVKQAARQRQGAVLSALLQLKQVCNHPSLLTGSSDFAAQHSGKLQRLLELCREIAERQEKVLVFTQFKVMTSVLAQQLTRCFGRPGLVLGGDTPIASRRSLVERFQQADGPPFFVLSVKAGGTGLTLTEAAHVIHFDRWWNPAVEDQATDRAYRIGQRRPVLVHKLVCAGTVEAKIDQLLTRKRGLADDVLSGGGEVNLSDLTDDELLALVSLDLAQAAAVDD